MNSWGAVEEDHYILLKTFKMYFSCIIINTLFKTHYDNMLKPMFSVLVRVCTRGQNNDLHYSTVKLKVWGRIHSCTIPILYRVI